MTDWFFQKHLNKNISSSSSSDSSSSGEGFEMVTSTNNNNNKDTTNPDDVIIDTAESSSSDIPSPTSWSDTTKEPKPWFFLAMTRCSYPFLVTLPFCFFLLICLGFSRPGKHNGSILYLATPSRLWKYINISQLNIPMNPCSYNTEIIEEEVANLWIPTDGSRYRQDKDYAKSVGATGHDDLSTFAAMAISR